MGKGSQYWGSLKIPLMYWLLNMGIFQPAMLVYQRVTFWKKLNERCKICRIHVWYKYVPVHVPYKSTIHVGIWVFPKLMGTPKWIVKRMENPYEQMEQMDDLGGTPTILGNIYINHVGDKLCLFVSFNWFTFLCIHHGKKKSAMPWWPPPEHFFFGRQAWRFRPSMPQAEGDDRSHIDPIGSMSLPLFTYMNGSNL